MPVQIDATQLPTLLGQEVAVSEWMPITQARIDQFAQATNDHQWIHVDAQRAQHESPYGATVAHGFLTLSLVTHLLEQTIQFGGILMAINYGLNRVRFPAPVPVGSQVRARFTLQAMEAIPNGQQLTWHIVIECTASEKPCCVAEWVLRVYG